jgi:hypothetical protein
MDELGERLKLAEEILSELATGAWVHTLNANDVPVTPQMGERVQAYWGRFENVSFVPPPCPDCQAKQATIDKLKAKCDRLRKALFSITEESVVAAIEVLRETKP